MTSFYERLDASVPNARACSSVGTEGQQNIGGTTVGWRQQTEWRPVNKAAAARVKSCPTSNKKNAQYGINHILVFK
jgi:hypothetical protein